jgi:hypothetical protein
MRLFELFENKDKKKKTLTPPPPRNFVAKNAQTTGAGGHTSKKFTRKEKHKGNSSLDESTYQSTDDKIAILKKWSLDNYTNGADTFVEAWDDEDFAKLLDDNNGDVTASLQELEQLASIYSDQQADARYYRQDL